MMMEIAKNAQKKDLTTMKENAIDAQKEDSSIKKSAMLVPNTSFTIKMYATDALLIYMNTIICVITAPKDNIITTTNATFALKANFKFKENVFSAKLACSFMMMLATIVLKECTTLIMDVTFVLKETTSIIINVILALQDSTSMTKLAMIVPKVNTTMTSSVISVLEDCSIMTKFATNAPKENFITMVVATSARRDSSFITVDVISVHKANTIMTTLVINALKNIYILEANAVNVRGIIKLPMITSVISVHVEV